MKRFGFWDRSEEDLNPENDPLENVLNIQLSQLNK
jgi:hypothetical protein